MMHLPDAFINGKTSTRMANEPVIGLTRAPLKGFSGLVSVDQTSQVKQDFSFVQTTGAPALLSESVATDARQGKVNSTAHLAEQTEPVMTWPASQADVRPASQSQSKTDGNAPDPGAVIDPARKAAGLQQAAPQVAHASVTSARSMAAPVDPLLQAAVEAPETAKTPTNPVALMPVQPTAPSETPAQSVDAQSTGEYNVPSVAVPATPGQNTPTAPHSVRPQVFPNAATQVATATTLDPANSTKADMFTPQGQVQKSVVHGLKPDTIPPVSQPTSSDADPASSVVTNRTGAPQVVQGVAPNSGLTSPVRLSKTAVPPQGIPPQAVTSSMPHVQTSLPTPPVSPEVASAQPGVRNPDEIAPGSLAPAPRHIPTPNAVTLGPVATAAPIRSASVSSIPAGPAQRSDRQVEVKLLTPTPPAIPSQPAITSPQPASLTAFAIPRTQQSQAPLSATAPLRRDQINQIAAQHVPARMSENRTLVAPSHEVSTRSARIKPEGPQMAMMVAPMLTTPDHAAPSKIAHAAVDPALPGVMPEVPTRLALTPLVTPIIEVPIESATLQDQSSSRSTTAPAEARANGNKFHDAVLSQIKTAEIASDRVRVELNPRGLGHIEIEVSTEQSAAQRVTVRADNPHVLQALRDERAVLIQTLGLSDEAQLQFDDRRQDRDMEQSTQRKGPGPEQGSEPDMPALRASAAHHNVIDGKQLDIVT